MSSDTIAAVLHLREASRLLDREFPALGVALLETAVALVPDGGEPQVREMEQAADRIAGRADGQAD